MKKITKRLTIPQYKERKEVFEALGYKEIAHEEKGVYVHSTFEVDNLDPHYHELRKLEQNLYLKGPSFYPIILLAAACFVLLSIFVIIFAKDKNNFDLVSNALGFLLPAFTLLAVDVVYTYFYFSINQKIILNKYLPKEDILAKIKEIRSK